MPPANESIDLVDRLVAEYADRLARDEDPRREELLARAPEFRAELERCFRMLEGGETGPGTLAEGLELGDFRLGRVLGRGGMAVVYEALQKSLGRKVALKVLRQHLTLEEKHFQRFQREARAAAKLAHENVVPIHAIGAADGHAFIAFELVPGPTLARVIDALAAGKARPTPADLARASGCAALASAKSYAEACVRLLEGVFAGVEHAHSRGVIHRDLKPSNVLFSAAGKPLVADFGLAKDLGEASLSITGETIGTPHYMAPEQASALGQRVDARTDVYALGVLVYELLTLRRPFEGRTLQELVHSIVTRTPRSPSELAEDVPVALGDVVLKAMEKDPARRYASVAELREDLERALRGAAVLAPASHGMAALLGGWLESRIRGEPFEYRSRRSLFGLPWIHVVYGVRDPKTLQPKVAKGVIASGDTAFGFYASGKFAVGFLALGFIAIGPIAIGAIALGRNAVGGVALGWHALGLMAAGRSGRGLLEEWVAHPDTAPIEELTRHTLPMPALFASLVGVALGFLLAPGLFSRIWPGEEQQRFIRKLARFWIPFTCLPYALHLVGIELPLMADAFLFAGISAAFGLLVIRKLGPPRIAARVRGVCEGCGAEQELYDERRVRICSRCGGRVRAEGTAMSERRHASQEILDAAGIVRVMRYWIGMAVGLSSLATIAAIRDLSAPSGLTSFTTVANSGVLLLATEAGYQLAPFHPFAATIALSLVGTASVLSGFSEGQVPLLQILFTLGCLAFVRPMRRATRALHTYPDLIASRRLLHVEDVKPKDAGALLASATRRAWRRAGLTAAILFVLVSSGSFVAWRQRPRDLDTVVRAFVEAWNGSETTPVIAFFPGDGRDQEAARFEECLRQVPEWPYSRPRIAAPSSITANSEPVRCSFSLADWRPGAELETSWRRTRGVWVLSELRVLQGK